MEKKLSTVSLEKWSEKFQLVGGKGCGKIAWSHRTQWHMRQCNSNSELLLTFWTQNELVITNTIFRHRKSHKATWMHLKSRYWLLIDFVITRQKGRNDVINTSGVRGANCSTDHQMLKTQIKFLIRKKHYKSGARPLKRIASNQFKDINIKTALIEEMNKEPEKLENPDDKIIGDCWSALKATAYNTAQKIILTKNRKHQDWFDENDGRLKV